MGFEPVPGSVVAGYRVVSEVGRGGTATVWLAEHSGLGRRVALKILASNLAEDLAFRTRFGQEGRIAAALEHPNVLPVYDAGEWEGLLYIAMRYVDGTDLASVLQRKGPLPFDRAMGILAQVAAALDAAHAHGLVHRDVKPANVLIDPGTGPGGRDHVYLADFGIARPTLGISGLTQAGELFGTVDYMAPEQLSGGVVDARSDVYAFFCLAYECLTGQPPFRRETVIATAAAHLHDEPTRLSELRPDSPIELDRVLMKGLSKDKTSRYRSVGEALGELAPSGKIHVTQLPPMLEQVDLSSQPSSVPSQPRGNLPTRLTTFVGRKQDVVHISGLLENSRLVTLLGPGGCGKTSLAVEVARGIERRFPAGTWLVELAALEDPSLVPLAAARAIGIELDPDSPPIDGLVRGLRDLAVLIILDNCEHVVDAAAEVSMRLLSSCPGLSIVATSREALNVEGETLASVLGLGLPAPALSVRESLEAPATLLLLDRMRAAQPSFVVADSDVPAVSKICHLTEGLPLALELVASNAATIPLTELAQQLELEMLAVTGERRSLTAHHRSLQAALDWSERLLKPDEKALLHRLWVFRGGFDLEAVTAVCGDVGLPKQRSKDVLLRLERRSLVTADADRRRFRMLEPVRQFAETASIPVEAERLQERHAAWVAEMVESAEPAIRDSRMADTVGHLRDELDNIRSALVWSVRHRRTDLAGRTIAALWWVWNELPLVDLPSWADAALELEPPSDLGIYAAFLAGAGTIAIFTDRFDDAIRLSQRSRDIARRSGLGPAAAQALINISTARFLQGELKDAETACRQGLDIADRIGDPWWRARSEYTMGLVALQRGEGAIAADWLERASSGFELVGDQSSFLDVLVRMGSVFMDEDRLDDAGGRYDLVLASADPAWARDKIALALLGLGEIAIRETRLADAATYLLRALTVVVGVDPTGNSPISHPQVAGHALAMLAEVESNSDRSARAIILLSASVALSQQASTALFDLRERVRVVEARERLRLGREGFQRAWDMGASIGLGDLIPFALKPPNSG